MANTKRKNRKINPCPVDCKKVILEVNCSDYSEFTSYPMPKPTSNDGWKVNTKPRKDCKVSGTSEMQKKFKNKFNKKSDNKIPKEMQKWAKDTYDIEAQYGKELLRALADGGHKPQMHHNLPIALGGLDDPSNYIPLPHDEHQKSAGGIHKWWDDELNEASDDLEKQLGKCDKNSKNRDKKKKKKEEALRDCSRNKNNSPKSTCESKITGIAGCLDKVRPPAEGVALYVRCEK